MLEVKTLCCTETLKLSSILSMVRHDVTVLFNKTEEQGANVLLLH